MNKDIKKIFIALFFFALSDGVFYNFHELWMTDNGLSIQTVGTVLSLCSLLTVSTIFLCSNLIDRKKIKSFTCVLILLKSLTIFALFILNNTGLHEIIKFLIMVDYVIDVETYACIYPMISYISKSDKLYAVRGLVYSYAYYGGILLTSLLLGKTINNLNITFNSYCLIGSILMFIAFIILTKVDIDKYNTKQESKNKNEIFFKILKKVKKDKITKNYLGYVLAGNASYYCINGMLLLFLTTSLGFSATGASNMKLILGILAVFIATIILEKLTLKNNYINISIKFVGRLILYILAILTNSKTVFLITIIFVRILAESYTHITDAPYINRFSSDEQLAFCNLKEMVNYLSRAIGNLLCGIAITLGAKYNFIFALIFIIVQLVFAFNALYLYNQEKGVKKV